MNPAMLSTGGVRTLPATEISGRSRRPAQIAQVLDLLAEDSRLNVCAGKLEVRPAGAPTTLGLGYSASAAGARLLGTVLGT